MFRIIYTFLDKAVGPELFSDGVVELKALKKEFSSKKEAFEYIETQEVKRVKKECTYYEGEVPVDIYVSYSFDGKQAYIDVEDEYGTYVGRYIYSAINQL